MATPQAAKHRDIEQRFRDIEGRVKDLTTRVLRKTQQRVSEGDFTVSGGGSVVVQDGGDVRVTDGGNIEVRDEGQVRWYGAAGNERFTMGRTATQAAGTDAVRLRYNDAAGRQRAALGTIVWESDGSVVGHGVLVESASNNGLLTAYDGLVRLGREDGGTLIGSEAGYPDFLALRDIGRDRYMEAGITGGQHLTIWGGQEGNGGLSTALQLISANGGREVRIRDGALSTYRPIAASDFITRSSSESTKDVLGDVQGSLEAVCRTSIKRWRYKRDGQPSGVDATTPTEDTTTPDPVERIGPMAEDVPEVMAAWEDPEGGVNLAASLWTLWQAVQELSAKVDALEARTP
jgi:hypothetical protein